MKDGSLSELTVSVRNFSSGIQRMGSSPSFEPDGAELVLIFSETMGRK